MRATKTKPVNIASAKRYHTLDTLPLVYLTKPRPPTFHRGFTLLEMLVVLVIIGLLAGLVGPRLFSKVDESKIKTTEAQIKMLKGALETYRLDVGTFPTTSQGLKVLYDPPLQENARALWKGPYLDETIPLDAWNNSYQYQIPGKNRHPYALYSLGSDGQAGGEDTAADIGYGISQAQ
jgi:general secretion pathway protein G